VDRVRGIKKKALMSSLIATMFVMALAVTPTFGQVVPSVTAPEIIDATGAYDPCTTFTIEIMVNDVEELWGFEFYITWDPNVLTCIGAFPVVPFTVLWPSQIGWGEAKIAASLPLGLQYGVAGDYVLAYMDFHVIALGSTFLDLQDTILTPWYATPVIDHTVQDGYFANQDPRYRADIKRAYPEHARWIGAEDLDQTLTAVVRNFGLVTRADVTITITDEGGMWSISYSEEVELGKREKKEVTWDVLRTELPGPGTYYVTNTAMYYNADTGTWLPAAHAKAYSFTFS
jgi:hypothetical protein